MASLNILLAIFLWSSLGVIVRLSGVQPQVLIFYSGIVAIAVLGTALLVRGFRNEIPDLRMLRYPLTLGLVGLINTFSYYYAFGKTTIANAVFTHYIAPVVVAFLAPVFLGEKITRKVVVAICIATLGLWLMLNGFSLGDEHRLGLMAGLASGFAYAGVILLGRAYTQEITPLVLTFVPNLITVPLLSPFVGEFPVHAAWSFIVVGIVHSVIAPLLYYRGLRFVSANRAASLGYLEPVAAIGFSALILRELPGALSFAGGALILLSGYLTIKGNGLNAEEAA